MGIVIDYTATCDNCGRIQKTHIDWTIKSIDRGQCCMDIWSPGLPRGWLQKARKDDVPLLFHSEECYKDMLRRTGQLIELEKFENSVWIG